jgi:hypothetical protein
MRNDSIVKVLGFCAVLSIAIAPATASACGDEVAPYVDYRVMGVAHAEQAVHEGRYVAAAGAVLRMFPEIRTTALGHDPIIDRAARTLALATVRAGGALAVDREVPAWIPTGFHYATTADHEHNLAWSVAKLEKLRTLTPNDPALESELGEALATIPSRHDDARKMLGDLAARDLVATPDAYAALARLRAEKGDEPGRAHALERCVAMAKGTRVCSVVPAKTEG